jgi:release factor glutamine methyltransferase
LSSEELAEFKHRLKRRLRREPLQYIEGRAAFRNLSLRVDRSTLIPRPETEVLVGEVLSWTAGREGLDVLDLGTGSGAIALSLRQEGRFGRIVAADISAAALAVARGNLAAAGLAEIEFREGALYGPVEGERFDVVVSNPPYIAEGERGGLQPEVLDWEPAAALFGGEDGLDVIRPLVAGAAKHLRPDGLLAFEIGAGQGPAVLSMIEGTHEFERPRLRPDLAGRDRIVLAGFIGASPAS